ncbi:hypothetical protein [Labilibacter marinus]|uniref:hypothetical protein n=1 Tax=Labilibacter marinus TaxID=1477105 RepID=UPI00094FD98D|nr:hypothetical protein [Labilibacter marinus]
MGEIIGQVVAKKSHKTYAVKYEAQDGTVWISEDKITWTFVCENITNKEDALTCAQGHIDFQDKLI